MDVLSNVPLTEQRALLYAQQISNNDTAPPCCLEVRNCFGSTAMLAGETVAAILTGGYFLYSFHTLNLESLYPPNLANIGINDWITLASGGFAVGYTFLATVNVGIRCCCGNSQAWGGRQKLSDGSLPNYDLPPSDLPPSFSYQVEVLGDSGHDGSQETFNEILQQDTSSLPIAMNDPNYTDNLANSSLLENSHDSSFSEVIISGSDLSDQSSEQYLSDNRLSTKPLYDEQRQVLSQHSYAEDGITNLQAQPTQPSSQAKELPNPNILPKKKEILERIPHTILSPTGLGQTGPSELSPFKKGTEFI